MKYYDISETGGLLRLQASKERYIQELKNQGFADGKYWALYKAEFIELAKLASYELTLLLTPIDHVDLIAFISDPDYRKQEVIVFPEGAPLYDETYLLSFVEAALKVFKKLK